MEEKLHTINLRREFNKSPNYKRSKKAVKAVKEYISRHMKININDIKIGKNLNLKIWENGRKNPPPKVKVKSIIQDSKAYVELPDFPFEETKKEIEKESKGIKEKLQTSLEKKEPKKEDIKAVEKERIKEEKKEHKHIQAMPDSKKEGQLRFKDSPIGETGKKGSHEPKR